MSIDNAYLGVTPLISGTLLPGAHKVRVEADRRFPWVSTVEVRSGQDLGINLTEANLPRAPPLARRVAYGTGVLALTAAATGGFLGILSQVNPSGDTHQSSPGRLQPEGEAGQGRQRRLHHRGRLAVISTAMFIIYKDDIFGRVEE